MYFIDAQRLKEEAEQKAKESFVADVDGDDKAPVKKQQSGKKGSDEE